MMTKQTLNFKTYLLPFAIFVIIKLVFRKLDFRHWSKVCKCLHVKNGFCMMFKEALKCFPSNNFLQVVKKNLFKRWSFLLIVSTVATYIFITPTYTTIIKGPQDEQKNGCQFLALLCGCNDVIKGIKGLAKSSLHYTMFSLKKIIYYIYMKQIYIFGHGVHLLMKFQSYKLKIILLCWESPF